MKTCLVAAIVLTAIAAAAQAAPASPCPAFFPEKGKTGAMRHAFLRPSVLNVDHDGREYDLAPDDEQKSGTHVEQTWQLDSYRDLPLVIRCHYRGTDKTVTNRRRRNSINAASALSSTAPRRLPAVRNSPASLPANSRAVSGL